MFPWKSRVHSDPVSYLENLVDQFKKSHSLAREKLETVTKRCKAYYDMHSRVHPFKAGDPVFILNRTPENKLSPRWVGPGVVLPSPGKYCYKVLFKDKDAITVNHDSLKLCWDSELPRWLKRAQKDILKDQTVKYCICRGPDNNTPMVLCGTCDDWFHCSCVNLTRKKAQSLPIFTCPNCEVNTTRV